MRIGKVDVDAFQASSTEMRVKFAIRGDCGISFTPQDAIDVGHALIAEGNQARRELRERMKEDIDRYLRSVCPMCELKRDDPAHLVLCESVDPDEVGAT